MTIVMIIALVLGVALLANSWRRRPSTNNPEEWTRNYPGVILALVGITLVLVLWVGHIHIHLGLSWMGLLALVTFATFVVTAVTSRTIWGLAFLVSAGLLVWLGLHTSVWVLVFAIVAAICAGVEGVKGSDFWAILTALAVAAAAIVGWNTAHLSTSQQALFNALRGQLQVNNQSFTDWKDYCTQVKPGSSDAVVCQEVNRLQLQVNNLQSQVEQNTKDIMTLQGQVAKVTERVNHGNVVIQSAGGNTDQQAAAAIAKALAAKGWKPGDVNINRVNGSYPLTVGGNPFSAAPITTKAALVRALNGTSPADVARRAQFEKNATYRAERQRVLSGVGYYAIQFTEASCSTGSDFYKNGVAGTDNHKICHNAGDIFWIYVDSHGKVIWDLTVRGACGNSHLNGAPTPQQPNRPGTPGTPVTTPPSSSPTTPSTPPSSTYTCPNGQPPDVNGLCGKTSATYSPPPSHTPASSPPGSPESTPVTPTKTATPSVPASSGNTDCVDPDTGQPCS